MSIQAMSWALDMGRSHELDAAARLLLLCMANYADHEGRNVFPSNATLQNDTGLSERTIRRHTRHLETLGLVAPDDPAFAALKIKRSDKRPNVYRLVMDDGERHSRRAGGTVDPSPRGATVTGREATGGHSDRYRGAKRGATVTPKPLEPSIRTTPADDELEDEADEATPRADVIALEQAARAKASSSRREPVAVVDLDAGRILREQIAERRRLKTMESGDGSASRPTVWVGR